MTETRDDEEALKVTEQQSTTQPTARLGIGRGKPRPETNNDEPPSLSSTTPAKWNGGDSSNTSESFKGFGKNNNDENTSPNDNRGFGARSGGDGFGARSGRGGGGGGFGSNHDGDPRACFNCNQSGHMSRDCPEPRKENRGGGGGRGNRGAFNSGGDRGGFNSGGGDRGGFNSRGDRGGFNSRGDRGGFNSGGDRGFNSRGDRGGFNSGNNREGFSSNFGGDRNVNYGSASNGGNGSLSITVRNVGDQNEDDHGYNNDRKPNSTGWRGSSSNDNDGGNSNERSGFNNSTSRGGINGGGGGFRGGRGGSGGGFNSNDRGNSNDWQNGNRSGDQSRDFGGDRRPRDGGSSDFFSAGGRRNDRTSDDIFDQPGGRSGGQPIERYIPPPPPTSEQDIFGAAVSKGENFEKYHRTQVQCTPEGKVKPIELYEEGNLGTQVLTNIRLAHFEEPTPIQRYTIPCIRQQDDIMACAQTGSGKTAAFLLPIISNLLEYHADELPEKHHPPSPLCLILSPTRELALQTEREARKFAYQTAVIPSSAVGGHDMFTVSDRLREGCHILSATTGRLKDMVEKGRVSLKKVKYFVLDEADRMLDTGFEPDIRKLEDLGLPPKDERFTSMFSATFPDEVQKLAKHFLRENYIFLAVGTPGGANEDIAQTIEEVPQTHKKERLLQLLEQNLKSERCLIFVETKRSADYIGSLLSQKQLMSTTMHGDRTQKQRTEAVQQFTNGKCPILVATSVAARGLDFPLIGYVVNYDLPDSSDFYIHRIGRTGRAGHLGKSISFFDPERESDRRIAPQLVSKLAEAGQEVPPFLQQYADGANTGFSRERSGARNSDLRSGSNNFGSRNRQQAASNGGTASAGSAVAEEQWD